MQKLSFSKVGFSANELLTQAEKFQVVGGYGECMEGFKLFYCACQPGWWPIESGMPICASDPDSALGQIGGMCDPSDEPTCAQYE